MTDNKDKYHPQQDQLPGESTVDFFLQIVQDTVIGDQDTIAVASDTSAAVQDTVINVTDTVSNAKDSAPPKPTFEQIRYWRWLREQKLLIGDSRYIKPVMKSKLVASLKINEDRLGLPVHDKTEVNNDWITILLILAVILIASVRKGYSKYVGYLFQSMVNYSTSFRMFRERNYPFFHAAFRLEILFYLIFSILIYQVIDYYQVRLVHENLSWFVSVLGMTLAYFMMKKAVFSIVGSVVNGKAQTSEYLFNMDNYNRIQGLMLFPVVALINYYPGQNPLFIVYAGIITAIIFYIFILQRGIYILLKEQLSIFYLFLYLCTLEFLPLLLIYKVVVL